MLFSESKSLLIPHIDFFIKKIKEKTPLQFAKLNLAFWDTALTFSINPKIQPVQNLVWKPDGWLAFHGVEFMKEMLLLLKKIPESNILLGVSNRAAPGVNVKTVNKIEAIRMFINRQFPLNYKLYYGPLMKKYALEFKLELLIQSISEHRDVLLVGMKHTSQIANVFQFKNFNFLELDFYKTTERREIILEEIKTKIQKLNSPVVLFQAGESLSLWFTYYLQLSHPNITSIDLGRALDFWCEPDNNPEIMPDLKEPLWKKLFQGQNIIIE